MEKIDFSVAMCVYGKDNPEQFDIAIESVINQTYKPTEVVLAVDGPIPDMIEEVIAKYQKSLGNTLKVIRIEKNVGHGNARRICFENCSFPLIALMDADDISLPDRFERQIDYYREHPSVSVVGGNISEFISMIDPIDTSKKAGIRVVPVEDRTIKEYMKKRCPMNQVTVMFKKDDIAEVGGYIDWYCEEDYYLWIRLALAGKKFGNINKNLVNVRVDAEMYQRRGGYKYFKSEARLQSFMRKQGMISFCRYLMNIVERFILQVMMPNCIRGWMFKTFARE